MQRPLQIRYAVRRSAPIALLQATGTRGNIPALSRASQRSSIPSTPGQVDYYFGTSAATEKRSEDVGVSDARDSAGLGQRRARPFPDVIELFHDQPPEQSTSTGERAHPADPVSEEDELMRDDSPGRISPLIRIREAQCHHVVNPTPRRTRRDDRRNCSAVSAVRLLRGACADAKLVTYARHEEAPDDRNC